MPKISHQEQKKIDEETQEGIPDSESGIDEISEDGDSDDKEEGTTGSTNNLNDQAGEEKDNNGLEF